MTDHSETTLSANMRRLAETKPAKIADELRKLADDLDKAAAANDGTAKASKRMTAAWTKARKVWCRETGEPFP